MDPMIWLHFRFSLFGLKLRVKFEQRIKKLSSTLYRICYRGLLLKPKIILKMVKLANCHF